MENILATVKKLIGVHEDYDVFDDQLLIHINTAIHSVAQIGVESADKKWVDNTAVWSDIINQTTGLTNQEAVKSLIYMKVWLAFDPPQSGYVVEAIKEQINELTFRIYVENDPIPGKAESW